MLMHEMKHVTPVPLRMCTHGAGPWVATAAGELNTQVLTIRRYLLYAGTYYTQVLTINTCLHRNATNYLNCSLIIEIIACSFHFCFKH